METYFSAITTMNLQEGIIFTGICLVVIIVLGAFIKNINDHI